MHFSQNSSAIKAHTDDPDLVTAHLSGFITVSLLREQLTQLESSWSRFPRAVVVDLRQVSGYGAGVPSLARQWLEGARTQGVERIALIANSSVLRTTAHVLSEGLGLTLRCFTCEDTARTWARGRAISAPRLATASAPVRRDRL